MEVGRSSGALSWAGVLGKAPLPGRTLGWQACPSRLRWKGAQQPLSEGRG